MRQICFHITVEQTLQCMKKSSERARIPCKRAINLWALSPDQAKATFERNISQCCCASLATLLCDVLRHVGCRWFKFENFHWCSICGCWVILFSFGRIRATMLLQDMRTGSICNTQDVAKRRNTVAKRTHDVALNNVAICCVEMLRSFGRGFKIGERINRINSICTQYNTVYAKLITLIKLYLGLKHFIL